MQFVGPLGGAVLKLIYVPFPDDNGSITDLFIRPLERGGNRHVEYTLKSYSSTAGLIRDYLYMQEFQ